MWLRAPTADQKNGRFSLEDTEAHRTNTTQWYRPEEEKKEGKEEEAEKRRLGVDRESGMSFAR